MFANSLIVLALLVLINGSVMQAEQIDVSLAKAELTPAGDTEKKITSSPSAMPTATATTTTQKPPATSPTTTASTTTTTQTIKGVSDDTTTTTASPTSTTPAPAPKPYPDPSVGQWNSSCILVKMALQLNITYETKDRSTSTALYNIPTNATYYDGQCKSVTQTIQVNWGTAEALGSMLLEFDLKNQIAQLTMLRFVIPIVGEQFPNALENQTIFLLHMGKHFGTPMKMSYHCTRPQLFNLTETLIDTEIIGTVTIQDVQVEAFRSPSNTIFSPASDCKRADFPGIVPIAVGIALIAMILIIILSYICARRHSNSVGYMSF